MALAGLPSVAVWVNSTDTTEEYIPLEFLDLYVTVADTRNIDPKLWRLA
jgi:hypothetical protein